MEKNSKPKLVEFCREILHTRKRDLEQRLEELSSGAGNDSKSSAGDKHETARAMMQLEQEKLNRQLDELLQMEGQFMKINFESSGNKIVIGTLVTTDKGHFLLSIPLGKVIFEEKEYMLLSPQSPLGKLMTGKKVGEVIEVNGNKFEVRKIE